VPPWFRSWIEHEQRATVLRIWQPSVLSGLLQTEEYARAILAVNPGVTEDLISERLTARLARQELLTRDDPPTLIETIAGGQVFEDAETHAALLTRFDTLRTEALRGTESLFFIEEMGATWRATGGRRPTPGTTAENA
jgi:hypothetical protein